MLCPFARGIRETTTKAMIFNNIMISSMKAGQGRTRGASGLCPNSKHHCVQGSGLLASHGLLGDRGASKLQQETRFTATNYSGSQ